MSYPPPAAPAPSGDDNGAPDTMPPLPYAVPPASPQTPATGAGAAYNFSSPSAAATDIPGGAPAAPMPDYAYRSPVAGVTAAALASDNPHPARYFAGVALGLITGIVCAFLYDKFVFYTGLGLGILASGIGFAVGLAVVIGCGRGGLVPAIIGGALSLFSMLVSRFMLLNDMASKEFGHTVYLMPNSQTIPLMFETMNFMTWIIIAIGVYGGFSMPLRANKQ